MRLCFGTFLRVLNCCKSKQSLQASFVARVIACIDPQYYQAIVNFDQIERNLSQKNFNLEFEGNEQTISKLLSCRLNFIFSDGKNTVCPELYTVIERFENLVAPYMDIDKQPLAILSLLYIIQKDEQITFANKENFKKYLGVDKAHLLKQPEYVFSGFLSKVLLYTVCSNVDNRVGQECVKEINMVFIDHISQIYAYDYMWNTSTQTLTLSFIEIFSIFNQAVQDYQLCIFIEKVDPTNQIDFRWIEKCENFLSYIKHNIFHPFAEIPTLANGKTLQAIQNFYQTLDDYTNYLGCNIRPLIDRENVFVPIYRDENAEWSLTFSKEVNNYRHQLISIYQDLLNYASLHIDFECTE